MESTFTVILIDGNWLDACEPGTDSLRFDGLSENDARRLARMAFDQGHQVVCWRVDPEEGR
jgi:hypothetical protein